MQKCQCGQTTEVGDQFCSQCGSSLTRGPDSVGPAPDPAISAPQGESIDSPALISSAPDRTGSATANSATDDHAEPVLLKTSASDSAKSEPQTVQKRQSPGLWLVGALILGALGWFMFAGVASPDSDTTDDGDPSTTVEPPPSPQNDDDQADTPANKSDDGPSEAAEPITATTTSPQPSGPILEETTGLGIIYEGLPGERSVLLNLDTGERTDFGPPGWSPVAAVGQNVLFADSTDENDAFVIAGADDLVGNELIVENAPIAFRLFVGVNDDDQVLFTVEDSISYSLLMYSEAGTLQTEIELPAGFAGGTALANGLFNTHDGGIYRETAGSFQRVAEGIVVATGERISLVHRCDAFMICSSAWYANDTWTKLSYPADYLRQDHRYAPVFTAGNDRWLITPDLLTSGDEVNIQILSIETGIVERTLYSMYQDDVWQDWHVEQYASISPDGRWLLDESDSKAKVLVDLDNDGKEFPVTLSERSPGEAIFIELQ